MVFREGDQINHALVGFPGRGAEAEDAVLAQDESLDARVCLIDLGRRLGQIEPRLHIIHQGHPVPIDLPQQRLVRGLVGERQDRSRMGVVHELVGQECVQQGLDGWVWRGRVHQCAALEADHVLVGQHLQRPQPQQGFHAHGGQAGRLDIGHVPAGALDA